MNCPKCNSAALAKRNFHSPLVCPECGGMWLESGKKDSLNLIDIEEVAISHDSNENDKKTGLCPSGHGIMIRARIDMEEPFYLEKCSMCGGIWFDKGEWLKIAELNLLDELSTIWSKAWQRKQNLEKGRDKFLKLNQKVLGDKIFTSIMDLSKELRNHPEKSRALALLQQEIWD